MHRILSQNDSAECAGTTQRQIWKRTRAEAASDFLAAVDTDDGVCSRLERGIAALYRRLAGFPEFEAVLAAATGSQPSTDQPWGWRPILETKDLRVGLLVVYRFGCIPLHDHPEAYGAQHVIAGRVRIRQFDEQPSWRSSGTLRSLKLVVDRVLKEGETASFAPDRGNIHGLETTWPRAVLITATAPPQWQEQRAWYYPLPLRAPERDSVLVSRMRRRPSAKTAEHAATSRSGHPPKRN